MFAVVIGQQNVEAADKRVDSCTSLTRHVAQTGSVPLVPGHLVLNVHPTTTTEEEVVCWSLLPGIFQPVFVTLGKRSEWRHKCLPQYLLPSCSNYFY